MLYKNWFTQLKYIKLKSIFNNIQLNIVNLILVIDFLDFLDQKMKKLQKQFKIEKKSWKL